MMRMILGIGTALCLALPSWAAAQTVKVSAEQLDCLPLAGNAPIRATVEGATAGSEVRLYFRRLHHLVEDFYYVEMEPSDRGDWWATFPKPEDHELVEKRLRRDGQPPPDHPWAAWWKAKEASDDRDPNGDLDDRVVRERASAGKAEARDWMVSQSDEQLQDFLEGLENEPAEYFVAVYDAANRRRGESPMRVVPVRRDCRPRLTPAEVGYAQNLTVGETAPWQEAEGVFHWLCDGIVTRIDDRGILRADEICRACVIAWWNKKEFLVPVAGVLGTAVVIIPEDRPVSPARPGSL